MTQFNPDLPKIAKENSNQKNQLEPSNYYYESVLSSLGFSIDMMGHFLGLVANSFNHDLPEIHIEKKEKETV